MNAPPPVFPPQWHASSGIHRTSSHSPAVCGSAEHSLHDNERWSGYPAELASHDNDFLAPPFVSRGSEEYTNFLNASCVIGQRMRDQSRDYHLPTEVGWGVHYGEECVDPFLRPVSNTDAGITEAEWQSLSAMLRDVDDRNFVWDGDIRRTEETDQQRNNATHADPVAILADNTNGWRLGDDVNWLPDFDLGLDEAFDSFEEVTSSHSQQAGANAPTKKRLGRPPGSRNRKPSKAIARGSTVAPGSTSDGPQASMRGAVHLNTPNAPAKTRILGHSGDQVDLVWVRDIPGMVSGFVDQSHETGRSLPYVDLDVGLVTETGIGEKRAPAKRSTAWFHDAIQASIAENTNRETGGGQDVAASGATSDGNDDRAVAQIDELRDACGKSRRKWICSICNKECQLKSRLQRHMYVHLKHVKYVCSCGEIFGRMDSMRTHRRRAGCVDQTGIGK